jgi:hypothetical protein
MSTRTAQVTAALLRRGLALDVPLPYGVGPESAAELDCPLRQMHHALEAARLQGVRRLERPEVGFTGERCHSADCRRAASRRIGRSHFCKGCAANFVRFYCGGGR